MVALFETSRDNLDYFWQLDGESILQQISEDVGKAALENLQAFLDKSDCDQFFVKVGQQYHDDEPDDRDQFEYEYII